MKARIVMFAALLFIAADKDKAGNAAKKEIDKIQGTWTPTNLTFNGKDHAGGNGYAAFRMVFKGDTATIEGSAEIKKDYGKVQFKFDPNFKPKLVDLLVAAGGQENAKMEGIYELKGDELKFCIRVFGNDRPTDFAAPEGSSLVLVVMKREKK